MMSKHKLPLLEAIKKTFLLTTLVDPEEFLGKNLGISQKKSIKGAIENKQNPILRKSLTMDIKLQNTTNNVKSGVLLERPLLNDMNNLNIICEGDDNSNQNANKSSLAYPTMDIELDSAMDKYDLENMGNPQVVGTVAKDIFKYLKNIECDYLPKQDYMTSQQDINEKMRAILIDWLVDVNVKFKLVPECLFMTVNCIDRFLTIKQVSRQKLQLVGVASLLIACKYEEIYPPALKEFVTICDHAYTTNQILDMEADILVSLDFKLTHTSAYRFLERFCLIADLESKAQ